MMREARDKLMETTVSILVVDDDPDIRSAVVRLLRNAGYPVAEAENGETALRLVRETRPDLVLLDVMLPDTDGYEICRTIKADKELKNTYVILLSGKKTGSDDLSEGLEIGADGYVARPVSNRELLARVQSMVRIIRAEANLKQIEWMLSPKSAPGDAGRSQDRDQGYGDLTELNHDGIILKSIGREHLKSFSDDYLELLGTSSAIYEANGDYAFGIFASGWCRMMDSASRRFCDTPDNAEALNSGCWLCHESCWTHCSREAILHKAPADISCNGGLRIYAVPIFANKDVVGAINFGYGDPPKNSEILRKLADAYHVDYDDLVREADAYDSRPPFIIELAKKRLHATARLIGSMIETKQAELALRESEAFIKTVMDHLPLGIAVNSVDPEVEFTYMNDNFPKIYRTTRESLSEPDAFWEAVYEDPVFRDEIKNRVLMDVVSGDPRRMNWEDVPFTRNGEGPFYICARNIPLEGKKAIISTVWDVTERNRAELALRESEEKLRTTLNSIGDAVISTDIKGRVVGMNPVAESLTGWRAKEAVGQPLEAVFRIVNEHTRQPVESPVAVVMKSGNIVGLANHTLLLAKDGREIPIADSGAPICNEAGDNRGVVLVFRDQTEERKARQALESNYALLKIAGETAHFGGWSVDLDNNICTWSDAVADIHEMPQGFAPPVEKGISFYAPEWRDKITQVFSACAKEGTPYDEDMEIITQKGKRVWVRTIGKAVRNKEDKIIKVQGSFQDITERKRIEQKLRESEEKYRNIFDNMQDVYYETSLDGALLEISPSIETISKGQHHPADLIGRQMLDFYPDAKERDRLIARLLESGSVTDFEISLQNRDGSHVPCSISAKLWRDDQGNPVKIIGTMRDITQRKHAEEEREKLRRQLAQAQKMEAVGRLAGGVAHDYNNMLSVILGYTEMALEQVAPADPLHADLKEVYNAGKRSMEITHQLLAFARKQIISPKVLDFNDTVEGMLKMLRRLIGEDIDLEWHPQARLWPVNMDPTQLDQILANLCVNARDAIADVGKITIETENITFDADYCEHHAGFIPGDFVMLAVSDNGCGMDAETLDNLFEPFFTTKEIGKGTGLGLATIYGIVKQNNGFINVYSEPGQGTTCKIYLPRHAGEIEETVSESAAELLFGMGEIILLVEDELKIIKMGKMMLEKLGYQVLTAETPGRAMELAREHAGKIHLLMTDVVMPDMNGRDLAQKLQALYPDLKVLFMSGYTANVIAHHGVLDEGVSFIQKPFSRKELAKKVREALG